jgi:hypothetical protein
VQRPEARVASDPSPWSRQDSAVAGEHDDVTRSPLAPEAPDAASASSVRDGQASAAPKLAEPASRLGRILETSPFPILLVSLVGIVLLSVFAPSIVVGDTWLTLMAGREVVDHGLPETETLTIFGEGATWTDQQWLAQVVFYAAHEVAGMRTVVLLGVALVLLALSFATATARTSGASSRSTFLVGLLAVLAGPWGWTLRAQTTALPLFAGTLWLLVDASRGGIRNRTLVVLPLLVVWANLHGSVVLGAALTVLLGLVVLVRARSLDWRAAALVVLAPLCVLATPYGFDIVAYYDLMLVDAPFAEILREWQWSKPDGTTALFWVLAAVTIGLLALRRCRSRLTFYELAVLAVTFVGAVQAVRGVIWFALATAAILPVALDGLLTRADVAAPKVNRIISLAALAGLALAFVSFVARPSSWFVSQWPEEQVEAVREATRDPSVRLYPTDGTADWLLWRIPDLEGRMAYDVRFELYDEATLDKIVDYNAREGSDWDAVLAGYDVVVVSDPEHFEAFRSQPGRTVLFEDEEIALIGRPPLSR